MREDGIARLQAIENIRRLLSLYSNAVSQRTPEVLAELFAPDARVTIADGPERVGRVEIVAGLERTILAFRYLYQTFDAGLINIEGDTARGRIGIMEMNRPADAQTLNAVFGVYEDQYCCSDERWYFYHRRFTLQYRVAIPASAVWEYGGFTPEVAFLP